MAINYTNLWLIKITFIKLSLINIQTHGTFVVAFHSFVSLFLLSSPQLVFLVADSPSHLGLCQNLLCKAHCPSIPQQTTGTILHHLSYMYPATISLG